jgi:putative PIN family toxin of toxin-antitoxin system
MKVVIDTNILVSAVIRDRLPERILLWCLEHPDVEWLVTPAVMAEYIAVIQRPKFKLPPVTLAWWLELLAANTRMIKPIVKIDFPRDRKDAPFLICAESSRADFLITGDGDFSDAPRLTATRICSIQQFAQIAGIRTQN